MNTLHPNIYYENAAANSPSGRSYQTQSLSRQTSRPFDGLAQHHNGIYGGDDLAQRYDGTRYNERMNATIGGSYNGYDMGAAQAWNSSSFTANNHLAALGATQRAKPARGGGILQSMWMEQPQPIAPSGGFPNLSKLPMGIRQDGHNDDEDLIPTAIVIKNIPFAVKKEQLVHVMTELNLPLPYAFNYHFDNGVFRGLAFANFTTPEETETVINAMNHLDLHGRKLRVEYKKMLPQAERDRIEREKRERRGQLEEQHRPMASSQLQAQPSMSSLSSRMQAASPSPVSGRAPSMYVHDVWTFRANALADMDMNDPIVLDYYSKLIVFQAEAGQDSFTFPSSIPPHHRTIIHGLAHQLNLGHTSHGIGDQRQIHIFRNPGITNGLSPIMPSGVNSLGARHKQLNRSATTDFTDVRGDPGFYGGGVGSTQSSGFLGFSDSQGGLSLGSNLRNAKSFADLRSYTPSPSQTAAGFPAGLANNIGRFTEYGSSSPGSTRSNVTPTTVALPATSDALLANGISGMRLTNGYEQRAGSPHRLRGMMSWDREVPGPIGGHRSVSSNQDDPTRNHSQAGPVRQPRGPLPERGSGFSRGRQNGHQARGSDEFSSPTGVETIVEQFP